MNIQFNRANFEFLIKEVEELREINSKLTALLVIQQQDQNDSGTASTSKPKPRAKAGTRKSAGRARKQAEVQ